MGRDIDVVSFLDFESGVYRMHADRMDAIVQPVEELGRAAGEQILKRVEDPDAPIFEKVLTSVYKPYTAPTAQNPSDR